MTDQAIGLVSFVGAGPGAPDLITLRGRDRIAEADVVIYADSLVHPGVAAYAKPNAEIYKSAALTLEETSTLMLTAAKAGRRIARVQSGDPSIYGAMHEQIALLERGQVPYEIIPGVSSAFAAAAALGVELTVPNIAQTVIFTRLGSRTPMPEREALRIWRGTEQKHRHLPQHSAHRTRRRGAAGRRLSDRHGGGRRPSSVTWEDELILRGTLADIASRVKDRGYNSRADSRRTSTRCHAGAPGLEHRSNLYNPAFTQRHRRSSTGMSLTIFVCLDVAPRSRCATLPDEWPARLRSCLCDSGGFGRSKLAEDHAGRGSIETYDGKPGGLILLAITHSPGCMFVTDWKEEGLFASAEG